MIQLRQTMVSTDSNLSAFHTSKLTRKPSQDTKPKDPPRQIGRKDKSNGPNFLPISVHIPSRSAFVSNPACVENSSDSPSKAGQIAFDVR